MANETINKIGLKDLIEKSKLSDDDILILEDIENTKRVSFRNLKDSLIEDEELPSTHRIYSSYKLDTIIKSFKQQLDYGLGELGREIDNIGDQYVSTNVLEKALQDFSKEVSSLAEVDTLKKALESKRDISVSITCDDLESGENEKKIQVKNLSSEVISMMTGETPVTPPAVPDGGWVQEDIANEAINAYKLSKQYRYRGHYPEGNINNFTKDGLYLLGGSVIGLPKYDSDESDEDRLLEVFNYGPEQYIVQKVYYCMESGENVRPIYYRKNKLSRLHVTDFIAQYPVTDEFKMTRNTLEDNIFNGGVISSGNVYDLTVDNNYLVKKGVKNLPDDKYDFTVSVRKYDTRIEYIAKAVRPDLCEVYVSNSYLTSSGLRERTQWYQTNTVKRSRFEGMNLHLFGDGVCYGLGSSDIPTLSFPALLSSKYGINVINHALGDATLGVYNDDYLEERSVIKQIENTELSYGDFAIIFAGGEDYKSGIAKLGNNADINDHTYKGALNTCIQKLLAKKPDIKIMVISPIFRARLDADDFRNSDDTPINELYLRDYSNAMKDACDYSHIPFFDLHSQCMINKYNFVSYLSDRLYLNDAGHEMISTKIFSALNYFY